MATTAGLGGQARVSPLVPRSLAGLRLTGWPAGWLRKIGQCGSRGWGPPPGTLHSALLEAEALVLGVALHEAHEAVPLKRRAHDILDLDRARLAIDKLGLHIHRLQEKAEAGAEAGGRGRDASTRATAAAGEWKRGRSPPRCAARRWGARLPTRPSHPPRSAPRRRSCRAL